MPSQSIVSHNADMIFQVEAAKLPSTAPHVPEPDRTVRPSRCEDVFIHGTPCRREHGATGVSGETVRARSGPEVDEPDGGLLRSARDEEVLGDGRDGVRVDDAMEVKRRSDLEGFGAV